MHSACGAYWNNERDGMWSFKYETKGVQLAPCGVVEILKHWAE